MLEMADTNDRSRTPKRRPDFWKAAVRSSAHECFELTDLILGLTCLGYPNQVERAVCINSGLSLGKILHKGSKRNPLGGKPRDLIASGMINFDHLTYTVNHM